MNKIKAFISIVFLLCSCGNKKNMNIVYPVEINQKGVYVEEKTVPENFYENLTFVLNYYKEPFERVEGKIAVRNELYNDKNLLSNYTNKAQNMMWIKSKKNSN